VWLAVTGLMAWSIAKHAYDAIQDIPQDSDTGIITTAVHLGPKNTAWWATFWWAVSTVLFALVNIPVAIANAAIAGLLVIGIFKTPTPEKAHDLYKYSIAFPYVAGAVAGVQLVFGLVWGLYP
jgi:4-hydroxybenzoate polyprenyltransferase